ncbi:MAG: zinc-dependent metalloprotease [Microthrixaceae bacterium]|nr:zinc-dependent metalloprotease [Microthrixaceae bacterium]
MDQAPEPPEDDEPNRPEGPFGGGADAMATIFGQLGAMMRSQEPWEAAAQMAAGIANEGHSEANLDPADRMSLESLARVAELRVADHTSRGLREPVRIDAMNRTQWARRFRDDQRPLLEGLAGSLGQGLAAQLGELDGLDDADASELAGIPGLGAIPPAMIRQLASMMGPMMLSMMAGSTAGHLAARAFGHYELPLPRPVAKPLTVVLSNVDAFAADWSIPVDDIRMWVCLSDVAHHQVLTLPHVRDTLTDLIGEYTRAFSVDPEEIERQGRELGIDEAFGELGADMGALQELAGNPDRLLGVMQSEHQRAIMPRIHAVVAVVEGWVDNVLDEVGGALLADYAMVTEALRRRRVEAGPEARFVERLFGLELSQATFDSGAGFVRGVLDRGGPEALDALWSDASHLPTPNELEAPGLWMARVGIEADDLDIDADMEIPDSIDFDD